MNIEINHLKDEIQSLRMQVEELNKIVLEPYKYKYFHIHYTLEYIEPIDIEKLLQDMVSEISTLQFHKIYISLSEKEDKTYSNSILDIHKFDTTIDIYIELSTRILEETFEAYFNNKLGTAIVTPFKLVDDLYRVLKPVYVGISQYYEYTSNSLQKLKKPILQ